MSFIARINQGDTVSQSASTYNSIADAVNQMGRTGGQSGRSRGLRPGAVLVYNAGTAALADRSAVSFTALTDEGVLGCTAYNGSDAWGVLLQPLDAGEVGQAVVSGAVDVTASLSSGDTHAAPSASSPAVFDGNSGGEGAMLLSSYSTTAVLLLGASGGSSVTGPFDTKTVTEDGVKKVKCHNSLAPSSSYAGKVRLGDRTANVAVASFDVSAFSVLYCECSMTQSETLSAELKTGSAMPTYAAYTDRKYAFQVGTASNGVFSRTRMLGNEVILGYWS